MLRITTLGGFAVERGEERVLGAAAQPRRMALLAVIARAGARGITRERLQSMLWPESDEEQGRHSLKQSLYALRRDAGAGDLFRGTRELSLDTEDVRCDVIEFESLMRRREYERAVALYGGPFLDGFRLSAVPEFEAWVEEERRALEHALGTALEQLSTSAMERGDSAAGVHWCRRLAALRPLDAAVTVRLMQALLASGDRAGALHQARIYEELISQELDLPPDEQVIDLARQIRDGRVAPASRPPPAELPPARTTTARVGERAERPAELSVAVIPWTTIGPSGHDDVVSDGLTEELLSTLARMPDLTVIAKPRRLHANTSVDAPLPLPDSATAVIEGSVRIASGRARVTARLVRLSDGLLLWSDRYERALDDVLGLERELASSIAEEVERALRRNAGLAPAPGRRERADALFEEGMRAWTPQGSGLGQGLERFRAAIAIDPEHARSHAALAESYTQLAFYGFLPSKRAAELVDVASREAMRLAPHLAESHVARGTSLLWVHRDFDAGTRELEHALELDPASVVAQARLAFVRLCHDGPMEAEPLFARRAATVPGATALSRVMYGQQFLAARRYDDAVEALHAAIDIEAPSFLAYHWLCVAYVQKGKGAEAVAAAVAEASISDRHPWSLASLIVACALAGQRRRAESLLATLTSRAAASHVQSSVLGIAHAALGDVDRGMSFLGRAVDEQDPSMMMLKWFPMFDPFRDHPRYRALLHRAGWRDWDTAEYPAAQRPPEHASRPGSRE